MKRTDTHRPSAINPSDYDYVGVEHMKIESPDDIPVLFAQRQRIQAHMQRTGGTYSHHQHGGNCHCCGAHCLYSALFHHRPTNTYIRLGLICAEKLSMGNPQDFRAIKRGVKSAREAKAGRQKAALLLKDAGLERAWELTNLRSDEEALVQVGAATRRNVTGGMRPCDCKTSYPSNCCKCGGRGDFWDYSYPTVVVGHTPEYRTLLDVVDKLCKFGDLSEKQWGLVKALVHRIDNAKKLDEERQAQKEAADPAPTGRMTIQGEVIKTEARDSDYGVQHKMTVKADGGYLVWGSIPSCLINSVERGTRLELTATFQPSDRDPKFAFFKRPIANLLKAVPNAN